MSDQIIVLYQRLRQLAFPSLGKSVGDFPLYDALLAGVADQYVQGKSIDRRDIPIPDTETVRVVESLREEYVLTEDERLFLEYFDVLEALQITLEQIGQ